MTFTSDQKADAGNAYITEIKRRIDVRSKAKALVPESKGVEEIKGTALPTVVKLVKRLHREASDTIIRSMDTSLYRSGHPNARVVDVDYKINGHMFSIGIDRKMVPEIAAYDAHNAEVSEKKRALCAELEFLATTALAPSVVAGFQAHASRLISVGKGVVVDKMAVALIDDFLTSRRGFTCAIK